MYVKKLIVLVYANKTLYYILLENFWSIIPPPPGGRVRLHVCDMVSI